MIAEQSRVADRLDEIVTAYLKAVEAGNPPDRPALLAEHPEWADELAGFFADLDCFEQVILPLRAVRQPASAGETVDDPKQTTPYAAPAVVGDNPATNDISGYEILGELGRGGMGVVYQARHVRLKRLVALKMIRAGSQAAEAEIARFRVEAEAVARLQHPHIVQIYEVGEHRGQPFCALEFVAGGTLAARLAGTPQPPHQAAALMVTLALAVDAAHQRGVVHRDLKPGNVLLAEDGSPKITDFGLAKRLDEDTGQTSTGVIMGTPTYMAPEQALGQKEVGPLADVYALGAILYEMLTGRPPFKGATVLETLDQVRAQEPVPVRLLQPRVPRDLETICLKCLAKEPAKRYPSAQALADDLERWANCLPIRARRSSPVERTCRWVRRNRLLTTLLAAVVLAFLLGFGGVVWQWRQTEAALDQAQTSLYFQRINHADREVQAGNSDGAEVILDQCPPERRHWEWHYLKRRCHGNWLRLEGHTDQVRCVAYSRDGKRLASGGNDGTVRVWDAHSGKQLLPLRGHVGWVNAVVFHEDNQRLVTASEDGTVQVWDAADGRALRHLEHGFSHGITLSPDGRFVGVLQSESLTVYDLEKDSFKMVIPGRFPSHGKAIALSTDGRRVAAPLDARLRIWEVPSGREVHVLQESMTRGAYCMLFSPDNRQLFASQHDDRYPALKAWDTVTGKELPRPLNTPLTVSVMAMSPDGRSLATGGHEGAVKVRDTVTGRDLRATRTFPDPIVALAFRPDGQGLAVGTGRDTWIRRWDKQNDQGPTLLGGQHRGMASVAYSPDGSRLASCGENDVVKIWDARTGQQMLSLAALASGYSGVAFSPDGRRVTAVGKDGTVHTWDAATGQPGTPLRVPGGELREAAYCPDGRRIATAGSDRVVRVWDETSGREVLTCTGHESSIWSVRFSPDGKRLASASSDRTVRLWDVDSGHETLVLQGHLSHAQCVAFHPGGRLLASGSTDETVRLWDIASGREVAKLEGHTGPIRSLCFSPDGRRLASASEDGTIRLWEGTTGHEALTLLDSGKVRVVTFSPDGWYLATAGSDGTVKLWNATPLQN